MWIQDVNELTNSMSGAVASFKPRRPRLLAAIGLVACVAGGGMISSPRAVGQTSNVPHELLYVADSNGAAPDERAQVLVVDPQQKAIVKTYLTHSHPDIALSLDGKRLYLAYYFDPHSEDGQPHREFGKLDVIDIATGAVIASVKQSEWAAMGPAYSSSMALSNDGHWLYMYVSVGGPGGGPADGVAVFDTSSNVFLPDLVSLPRCGAAVLVPWTSGQGLSVICSLSSDVRTVQFGGKGVPGTRLPIGVSIPHRHDGPTRFYQPGANAGFMSGDKELTVIMSDGRYWKENVQTGATVQEGAVQFSQALIPTGTSSGAGAYDARGRYVGARPIQGVQGKMFVVLSRNDRIFHAADAIAVLDAKTLQQTSLFQPGYLFGGAVLSGDGKRLYLLSADADSSGKGLVGNIHVLDSSDGTEIEEIPGIGSTPTILIPSP
jgi:hypothetical protein